EWCRLGYAAGKGRHRGGDPRVGPDAAGRHGRQRRAAHHRHRPRRQPPRAAVDHQRLLPLAGLPDPARRLARRPVRTPAGLRRRHRLVRPGIAAVRARADRRGAHRGAGASGDRRSAAHPRQPRDDPGRVRRGGPQPGDRRVVRPRRDRSRDRSARGWRAGGPRVLALDLPHQPPPGRGHHLAGPPLGARDAGPALPRAVRRHGRRAGVARARRAHGRADRLAQPAAAGRCDGRSRGRRRLPAVGAPGPRADGPARPLPRPHVQRGQRDDPRGLRRPGGDPVLPRAPAADRRRLLRPRGRTGHPADHGRPAAARSPRRRPRPADRTPGPDDGGSARDGARHALAARRRHGRVVVARRPPGADGLRPRPRADGRPADRHGPRCGSRRQRRHRERHQQRRGPGRLAARGGGPPRGRGARRRRLPRRGGPRRVVRRRDAGVGRPAGGGRAPLVGHDPLAGGPPRV
ncbi:MAG: Uncharacterized MFS-type transporter, partial [uncultured Nocardioidaceae bacterium]